MIFGLGGEKVSVEIDPGQGPFYPGSPLHVTVNVRSRKKLKVSEVRASLLFQERYTYKSRSTSIDDDDEGTVTSTGTEEWMVLKDILMGEGTIPAGFNQTYELDWTIPEDAAPPYDGKIIKGRWLVKVTFDRKLRKDINKEVELPLIVPPPGRRIEEKEYGDDSHPDKVEMRLWLPRLEWVEGETIEGKLKVHAVDKVSARQVRIELIRREEVPYDQGNVSTVTEFKENIAGGVKLNAGEVGEFPFSVTIPAKGCPTHASPVAEASWILKGVLSRRLRKDFTVTQEILVYNGSKPEAQA